MIALAVGVEHTVSNGPLFIAAAIAVAAGAVSFLSPCVLPLVPGYLSYVTGLSGLDLEDHSRARRRLALGTLLFVLGFTAVFVSYGALFGHLGNRIVEHERTIDIVLGALTVVLGLAFSGLLGFVPGINREFKLHRLPRAGLAGAPLLGTIFGIGWTPCIGPTLGAVNGLAIDSATAGRGALLSFAYCLGLGLPFLFAGVAYRQALAAFTAVRRHQRVVLAIGGVMLVALGILEMTGTWNTLMSQLRSNVGPGTSFL